MEEEETEEGELDEEAMKGAVEEEEIGKIVVEVEGVEVKPTAEEET